MATDLSTVPYPDGVGFYTVRVAMDATAGNVEKITLPAWASRVTIAMKRSDDATDDSGKLASAGTDGAAVGNDWIPIASSGLYTWAAAEGGRKAGGSFYLAAGTNGAYAHLSLEVV